MQRAAAASMALRRVLSDAVASSSSSSQAFRQVFLGRAAITCARRLPELPHRPVQPFIAPTYEFSRGYAQSARRPAPKKEAERNSEDDDDDDASDDYEGREWVDDVDDEWNEDDEFSGTDESD